MFSHYNGGGIPGYSLFVFVPLALITVFVIIRKQKRKLN
jgi:preprotein translocase subunit YajC